MSQLDYRDPNRVDITWPEHWPWPYIRRIIEQGGFGSGAGLPGRDGRDGRDGKDGATFVPSVSSTGLLSWTNNKGLPNPTSVNLKGDPGKDGLDGVVPKLQQGTVTRLSAGANPTMTLTFIGDSTYRLDLGIPEGEEGESAVSGITPRGDWNADVADYHVGDYITYTDGSSYVAKGDVPKGVGPTTGRNDDPNWQLLALKGAKGEQGNDGPVGANGADGVTPKLLFKMGRVLLAGSLPVINVVEDPVGTYTITFDLPEGPQGSAGVAGTVTVGQVTELAPGTLPTVSNSGTDAAAVLDFGFPHIGTILSGTAEPAAALGQDGDFYVKVSA